MTCPPEPEPCCPDCRPAAGGFDCNPDRSLCPLNPRALAELEEELDELERTDPAVRAAAESYDAMVGKITGRQ